MGHSYGLRWGQLYQTTQWKTWNLNLGQPLQNLHYLTIFSLFLYPVQKCSDKLKTCCVVEFILFTVNRVTLAKMRILLVLYYFNSHPLPNWPFCLLYCHSIS